MDQLSGRGKVASAAATYDRRVTPIADNPPRPRPTPFAGVEALLTPEHAAVTALLADGLGAVDERFDAQLRSDLPPVRALVEHVERYRGKMLRPTLTLLSGLAAATERGGDGRPREPRASDITPAHVTVGAVVEMIHVATLVHDDVLDDADTRRRSPTVNFLRGNETAVILGDYLISSAFHLCSQLATQDTALLIGAVTTRLCEGELLQLHHREDLSLDEPTYFEIVERKTAELVGAACELGAAWSGADADTRRRHRAFGVKLGVAFQLQDDLLDLTGQEAVVGKSVGKDLEKGKLTLPIIHHLRSADALQRGRTLRLLGAGGAHGADPGAILDALRATGSIEHARREAERLASEAASLMPGDNPAHALMRAACLAAVNRPY